MPDENLDQPTYYPPDRPYPVVTVPLHQIESVRRTISHLSELHSQADAILSDLSDTVANMPNVEDFEEGGAS